MAGGMSSRHGKSKIAADDVCISTYRTPIDEVIACSQIGCGKRKVLGRLVG